ncbi:LINE-1 retrotransposable element ORF2 protein [Elysia marginata]|uniref:LINE-1 retrotransposable element ORF2 protein n=1 Tax=Elysia marginata TaxID=1093978 RepID=A0AAV4EMY1_9GAST|nr:LINE-1 retrotransposable element ORF2 protein [Elysia marginata]
MYDGTCCRIVHDGQLTDRFNIRTGVRQGCLLSPFLFILAIDWLMRETTKGVKNGIQWTLWTKLEDLDFADDLALLSRSHTQMQAKTTTLNKLSESIGLRIHPAKSKVLRVGTQTSEAVMIGDQPLEDVDAFCYLGSNIDLEGGTSKEIKARIGNAQAAFTTLGRFWKTRDISLKTKLRIFNSNVKSVLLYGCEAWNASTTCIKKDPDPDCSCDTCKSETDHNHQSEFARKAYKRDQAASLSSQTNTTSYASVDLQKEMMLPRLPGVKSCMFTKRIIAFNETFAALRAAGKNTTVVWHEAIAGRLAQDICSTYWNFFLEKQRDTEHIVLWADNCSAQNKN